MRDIMLDLETFGNGNNAAIVSIGLVAFNADSDALELGSLIGDTFERRIDLDATRPEMRGDIDPSTVEWWLQQGPDARQALVAGPRVQLGQAVWEMLPWLGLRVAEAGDKNRIRLWSNGPTFDEIILRSAFRRYNLNLPISFRASRCCRTLRDQALELGFDESMLKANALQHDALQDSIFQARGVILMKQYLRTLARLTPSRRSF